MNMKKKRTNACDCSFTIPVITLKEVVRNDSLSLFQRVVIANVAQAINDDYKGLKPQKVANNEYLRDLAIYCTVTTLEYLDVHGFIRKTSYLTDNFNLISPSTGYITMEDLETCWGILTSPDMAIKYQSHVRFARLAFAAIARNKEKEPLLDSQSLMVLQVLALITRHFEAMRQKS